MERLLEQLAVANVSNALIILDNAKYHKTLPHDTAKSNASKANMQIAFDASESRSQLWAKLAEHIARCVVPEVCTMARTAGHGVLFTPRHHSDLQPIELVLTIVKGEVGRQYTTDTTFADVKHRLDQAFERLSGGEVAGCIRKTHSVLEQLAKYINIADALQSDTEDGESSGSESSDKHKKIYLIFVLECCPLQRLVSSR
ncbi:hypothetical protein PybrP1_002586 [[Pythium] brassicae (nom. inval.)]|nr:hypothetical protein PybrP1_002586 [[Pythium] brassicae (nom. inval.)]